MIYKIRFVDPEDLFSPSKKSPASDVSRTLPNRVGLYVLE